MNIEPHRIHAVPLDGKCKVQPRRASAHCRWLALAGLLAASTSACGDDAERAAPVAETAETEPADPAPAPSAAEPMQDPVPFWRAGAPAGEVDASRAAEAGYLVLELGEEWTPYIFSERGHAEEEVIANPYRATYLALARGEFPDDHHGQRARKDKFLELYGIPPTLTLVRERFEATERLACAAELDYETLRSFTGFISYEGNHEAERDVRRFRASERAVRQLMRAQGVEDAEALEVSELSRAQQRAVRDYKKLGPLVAVITATQERLRCEGYLAPDARYVKGGLDWVTHGALADFERRHRVFGWGFIGRDTLPLLQKPPIEGEHETVLRVLTERALHAASVIEDGSRSKTYDGKPITYVGADGKNHPVPNFERELRERIVEAFGLETPESTLAFLRGLGDIGASRRVAIPGIERPEYYADDMPLSVEIYRGDVWYEFPYDEQGNERGQPVSRRPRMTVYTEYRGQKIPLARFGTTIGGWRSESVEGTVMWKYKESPAGERVWHRIVAAPVWIPPDSSPPRSLLTRNGGRGKNAWAVNVHEMGPSYASAYGLVAAYHQRATVGPDGTIQYGGDQGIRSHGSVDYMSIMRRQSHGCHRLHNHIAVRLMSFVLQHRKHRRVGPEPLAYGRSFQYNGHTYRFALNQGGYVYTLDEPLPVNVLRGRVLGSQHTAIQHPLPQFNREVGAYILPDGQAVSINARGVMTPIPYPVAEDAGVPGAPLPQAGVPPGAVPAGASAPPATTAPPAAAPPAVRPGAPPSSTPPGVRPGAPPAERPSAAAPTRRGTPVVTRTAAPQSPEGI